MFLLLAAIDFDRHLFASALTDYLRGFGALLLIALSLGWHRLKKILNTKIFLWLGHISYSLYLIHFVMMFIVHALNEKFGEPLKAFQSSLAIVALSLMVADSTARWIEQPFNKLGKKLGHYIDIRFGLSDVN